MAGEVVDEIVEAIRAVVREELGKPRSPWLDPEAAAHYLGSTVGSLKNWRSTGQGPKYQVCGGRMIRYHTEDLDRFVRTGER